jgi:seryl-tRNA(Sec) selenium transferase
LFADALHMGAAMALHGGHAAFSAVCGGIVMGKSHLVTPCY